MIKQVHILTREAEDNVIQSTATIDQIRQRYKSLAPMTNEQMRRQWEATVASAFDWGGVTAVTLATALARNTIMTGTVELSYRKAHPGRVVMNRIRGSGGGRKALIETDPELLGALEALINPVTREHPQSPLRWTSKSKAKLAEELRRQQHRVSVRTVATLQRGARYSLQANRDSKSISLNVFLFDA